MTTPLERCEREKRLTARINSPCVQSLVSNRYLLIGMTFEQDGPFMRLIWHISQEEFDATSDDDIVQMISYDVEVHGQSDKGALLYWRMKKIVEALGGFHYASWRHDATGWEVSLTLAPDEPKALHVRLPFTTDKLCAMTDAEIRALIFERIPAATEERSRLAEQAKKSAEELAKNKMWTFKSENAGELRQKLLTANDENGNLRALLSTSNAEVGRLHMEIAELKKRIGKSR